MPIGSLGVAHAAQRPNDPSVAHRHRAQQRFPQALQVLYAGRPRLHRLGWRWTSLMCASGGSSLGNGNQSGWGHGKLLWFVCIVGTQIIFRFLDWKGCEHGENGIRFRLCRNLVFPSEVPWRLCTLVHFSSEEGCHGRSLRAVLVVRPLH